MSDSVILPKPKSSSIDRRPVNMVVVEGTVCVPPAVSVSRSGKPLLKVCLSVMRPPGVPRKLRPDGTEDPDYPWFVIEGEEVTVLAQRIRKSDRLFLRGALTTRNVDEKTLALNGDEIQDLQTLTGILSDYLNGVAPDVTSLDVLRELNQKFVVAMSNAETRKRVVTEVGVMSARVLRDRIAPGDAVDLTALPSIASTALPLSAPAPTPPSRNAPATKSSLSAATATNITRNQHRNQKKKLKKKRLPPPPPDVVYQSKSKAVVTMTLASGGAQTPNAPSQPTEPQR